MLVLKHLSVKSNIDRNSEKSDTAIVAILLTEAVISWISPLVRIEDPNKIWLIGIEYISPDFCKFPASIIDQWKGGTDE